MSTSQGTTASLNELQREEKAFSDWHDQYTQKSEAEFDAVRTAIDNCYDILERTRASFLTEGGSSGEVAQTAEKIFTRVKSVLDSFETVGEFITGEDRAKLDDVKDVYERAKKARTGHDEGNTLEGKGRRSNRSSGHGWTLERLAALTMQSRPRRNSESTPPPSPMHSGQPESPNKSASQKGDRKSSLAKHRGGYAHVRRKPAS